MHMNTLESLIVLGRFYDEISRRFSSTPLNHMKLMAGMHSQVNIFQIYNNRD